MKNKIDFAVGGQAVIEGVMMRSPNFNIVCVRAPDGNLETRQEFYQNITARQKFLNLPILRGVINMLEMMLIGTKALNYSSSIALRDIAKPPKAGSPKFESAALLFSVGFALVMSIFLFKFLPLLITDFLSKNFAVIQENYLVYNLIDGLIKSTFFIVYIALLTLLPDVKRVFQYHGAEHKSIMTYEQGLDLTVANALPQTRFHPRCGTSFILIVFLLSVFVFTVVPRHQDLLTNFSIRLAFLPVIAGLSYEFLKLSAKYPDNLFFKIISKPGLLMQKLTTSEPTPEMLEVSLSSLKSALAAETELHKKTNHDAVII